MQYSDFCLATVDYISGVKNLTYCFAKLLGENISFW